MADVDLFDGGKHGVAEASERFRWGRQHTVQPLHAHVPGMGLQDLHHPSVDHTHHGGVNRMMAVVVPRLAVMIAKVQAPAVPQHCGHATGQDPDMAAPLALAIVFREQRLSLFMV